ncbi:hypothetical protein D9M71_450870 [compost metagenome]
MRWVSRVSLSSTLIGVGTLCAVSSRRRALTVTVPSLASCSTAGVALTGSSAKLAKEAASSTPAAKGCKVKRDARAGQRESPDMQVLLEAWALASISVGGTESRSVGLIFF